jgi:predicted oxidoreductase (fatty acid repression mutant protein)
MSQTIDLLKLRRTHYNLVRKSPLSEDQILDLIGEALRQTPTAFNAQEGRVAVLFSEHHDRFWEMVYHALEAVVPKEQFPATAEKIDLFARSFGTVLYFIHEPTVAGLQAQFPLYAHNFPVWAQQANGILQNNIWLALSEAGLGASLQHYTELIEDKVHEVYQLPSDWKLIAQMPFGLPDGPPPAKDYLPLESRLRIFR